MLRGSKPIHFLNTDLIRFRSSVKKATLVNIEYNGFFPLAALLRQQLQDVLLQNLNMTALEKITN